LAYGVFGITDGPLFGWAYLFIIEGCLTTLFAIATFFILPKDIRSARFLTTAEKDVGEARLSLENAEAQSNTFSWKEAGLEFMTIHPYIRILINIAFGVPLSTAANFVAIVTVRLGYSVVTTNLVRKN